MTKGAENFPSNRGEGTSVDIHIVPGSQMPRFEGSDVGELMLTDVIITERAMESGLPALDLMLVSGEGQRFYAVCSGRIACAIAAAVRGINLRNHGREEP